MEFNTSTSPKRIAIIGGGVSGISCAWALRYTHYIVDIFEADNRLGGHANSVPFQGNGYSVNVDTGFITMNEMSYPRFSKFLRELNVQTIPTDMSFGVSTTDGKFEWGSYSVLSFVGKISNLLQPWFWRLLFDLIRFTLFARDILIETSTCHKKFDNHSFKAEEDMLAEKLRNGQFESIGEYLRRKGYSEPFINIFFVPMVAAPWCIEPKEFARSFPAKPLISFMDQHGLLDTLYKTLRWRTFKNGSTTYIDAFQRNLPSSQSINLNRPVKRIVDRSETGATLVLEDGNSIRYDHIVLAVHANQALSLLQEQASLMESSVLQHFKTSKNICYLHSDTSLLPKRASACVAWNCLLDRSFDSLCQSFENRGSEATLLQKDGNNESTISITFDMNKLQGIPSPSEANSPGRVLVTMNPVVRPRSPQSSQVYYHPLITSECIFAAEYLQKINGIRSVSFAGAWMGWGFHEDGFAAGEYAALMLTQRRENLEPLRLFNVQHQTSSRQLGYFVWFGRMIVSALQDLL